MHLENMKKRYLLLETLMPDHLGMELMVVPLLMPGKPVMDLERAMLIDLESIPSEVMALKLLPLIMNRVNLLNQLNPGLEDEGKLAAITYRIQ